MKKITIITLLNLVLLLSQIAPVRALQDGRPALTGGSVWYVATNGNDSNDCLTVTTPCLTINAALGKAVADDTIKVAAGIYTSTSGTEVVTINKNINLSGGWDATYSNQSGNSIIDGEHIRTGITLSGSTAVIDHFTIQNGTGQSGGGVASNFSVLTISNSIIKNNISTISGGGITNNNGTLILNDTLISNNQMGDACCGGGGGGAGIYLHNPPTTTLNRSAVINNKIIGGFSGSGISGAGGVTLILNNSTVSGNTGSDATLSINPGGTAVLNSSTISNNQGKGVKVVAGTVSMRNTLIALNGVGGNINSTPGDCYNDLAGYNGTITSLGHNLIGDGTGCSLTAAVGDQIGTSANPIDPKISPYPIGKGNYHLLLSDSPAINAADPATCPATDQRGIARPQGPGCDIGAYEYGAPSGPADYFGIYSGANQSTFVGKPFSQPPGIYVVDNLGNPVNGVDVVFTIPSSGASGVFTNINIKAPEQAGSKYERRSSSETYSVIPIYQVTVKTVDGIALIPLRANSQTGSYIVNASVPALAGSVNISLTNLPFDTQPNYLQNGDFEDPKLGNFWGSYSPLFGTQICRISCGNGAGTAGPRSGSTWVWFGGVPAPYVNLASINQDNILIPAGPAHLRFYLWIGYAEAGSNSNDKIDVIVDGKTVFSANATQQDIYPNYKLVDIDLSRYTNQSSTHSFYFTGETHGHLVNFNLDDISINNSSFGDMAPNYWAWNYIERLYNAGVTGGCSVMPLQYCPDNEVTRAQMAIFLLKGIHGSNYTPPALGGSTGFGDVPVNYWAAPWIKQLALESITSGCGNGNYCPETIVTRDQMAIFLLKAKHGSSYAPPNPVGIFTDVPLGYWADKWIEQLAAEGITGGCGAGIYCPTNSVTRAQMAVFLVKAFNLP